MTLVGKAPGPPNGPPPHPLAAANALDSLILSQLRATAGPDLPTLIDQYTDREGHVLEPSLPYESRPDSRRRVDPSRVGPASDNGVVMIAHAIHHQDQHKVALSSGFVLNVPASDQSGADEPARSVIVTCAHTLLVPSAPPLSIGTDVPACSEAASGTHPYKCRSSRCGRRDSGSSQCFTEHCKRIRISSPQFWHARNPAPRGDRALLSTVLPHTSSDIELNQPS